ncbi:elongator complex protein 3 [Persicobacter sp. CCB-QB2]|uniref:elongator complex protein 3 n=1 Tax=Persicobacter sp. CCB-QB2 TaxID=1561025 RepID=UPI0006A969E7|nr:radical SAM protein [Persicobacter sp. CCB-QB2]
MKKKHYNIPIFIPELACPHQCVFCDQVQISGEEEVPAPEEVPTIIESYLQTMDAGKAEIEIAFFGGSFTGIPAEQQEAYLSAAHTYLKAGKVHGIRLSTRPDYIDEEILNRLQKFGVTAIELGAQSMDPLVLKRTARGHSIQDVYDAVALIKKYDFELGLQMMIGLPEDTLEKALFTAKEIIKLGAETTRIYPTLIIPNTALHRLYKTNRYQPLELEDAVNWVAEILPLFEAAGIKVLRTGLHPSDDLRSGKAMVAGPFHPSFKELVLSRIWGNILKPALAMHAQKAPQVLISVPPNQLNYAVGFKAQNRNYLKKEGIQAKFVADANLSAFNFSLVKK